MSGWHTRLLALGALIASTVVLCACTSSIADLPGWGTPADAPPRPKEQGAFPPVNDPPPNRADAVMDPKERARIEAELIAARDHQAVAASAKEAKDTSAK